MIVQKIAKVAAVLVLFLVCLPAKAGPLTGVKSVQVDPTQVPDPGKVKETWAANWIHDQLAAALQQTGFQAGDAPIHAWVVLEEFTSGSTAKRVLVGMGAGRSSITATIVFQDTAGAEAVGQHENPCSWQSHFQSVRRGKHADQAGRKQLRTEGR